MNLWADDETTNPPLVIEETGGRKPRVTERAMLSSLRSWLLTDYVPSYSHRLAAMRVYRRCYWVDGWGGHLADTRQSRVRIAADAGAIPPGKGRNKETTPVVAPILQPIVALSAQLAAEPRPISLHGLILEAGSSTRRAGKGQQGQGEAGKKDATEEAVLTFPKESGIIRATWLEASAPLLREIDQSPAIFLLNPFGAALFRYDDLAPLYSRSAPTELCLLISQKQVETQLLTASHSPTTATVLTALLRSDRWKTLLPQDGEGDLASMVDALNDLLVASMQRHFLTVQRIPLHVHRGPATLELAPATLLFATRGKDSLLCMNDAVCTQQRRLREQSYYGVLGEEWFVAQERERHKHALVDLRQRIAQLGQRQRNRRWPDLRQHLLIETFGHYTTREYDEALMQLLREGGVRCEWRSRPPMPESQESRVPGNDDLLVWK